MTDRKLGSGISGRVFMVVDRFRRRQMACKIVQLQKCHADHINGDRQNGSPGMIGDLRRSAKIWREVDLLKDLSHVCESGSSKATDNSWTCSPI